MTAGGDREEPEPSAAAGGGWRLGRHPGPPVSPAVAALIAVNVAAYVAEQHTAVAFYSRFGVAGGCRTAICDFSLLPEAVHHGQWYRLLTSAFLHANLEHILFNMLTLVIVGPAVELELGRARFTGLYLVSALGGSVASYLSSSPYQLGIGASGAIFGLMGAFFVLARRSRWDTGMIVLLIALNLAIGFGNPAIDWRDHLGGLAAGTLAALGLAGTGGLDGLSRGLRAAAGATVLVALSALLGALVLAPPGSLRA